MGAGVMSAAAAQMATEPAIPATTGDARSPGSMPLGDRERFDGGIDQIIELGLLPDGEFEHCLGPLLEALGWRGEARHLIEAMPHLETLQSLNEFRLVLHRLGFRSTVETLSATDLERHELPLIVLNGDRPFVALEHLGGGLLVVYDARRRTRRRVRLKSARVRVCRAYAPLDAAAEAAREDQDENWFSGALSHMGRDFRLALWLTLACNILALAPPLFSMSVYNAVLPSDGVEALLYISGLAVLAILVETQIRSLRGSVLSSGSARVNCALISTSLARIVFLPLPMLERASVSSQLSRLKQFENVFGVFNGGVASAALDLPFAIIFILTIWLVAGPLVWAPIVAIILFGVMTVLLQPVSKQAMQRFAASRDREQTLLRETLTGIETVQSLDAEVNWRDRLISARRRAVSAKLASTFLEQMRQSAATFLLTMTSIVTLTVGAILVMQGELTVGALVGVTMLSSRILMPMQTLFLAIHQISSARSTVRQINSLMKIQTERAIDKAPTVFRQFEGRVRFSEVSFRFPKSDEFAVRGVSAEIGAGEVVGVVGPAASGKSTLLKLVIGLYRPSGGKVFLDGLNLAQLDVAELRAAVAFAPSEPEFFYGTVAQNMKLARSTATEDEIQRVFEELELELTGSHFRDGMETRLGAAAFQRLPETLRQKLSLARAFVKDAPVLLLDNPGVLLDADGDAALRRAIERRKGRTTVILATREPKHVALCDKVMLLADGQLAGFKKVAGAAAPTSGPGASSSTADSA